MSTRTLRLFYNTNRDQVPAFIYGAFVDVYTDGSVTIGFIKHSDNSDYLTLELTGGELSDIVEIATKSQVDSYEKRSQPKWGDTGEK